ncbi:MAG TPA: GrpB family protein [Marmoricola sp.]|nr:GrpB family protein [Marmoricola sp.]
MAGPRGNAAFLADHEPAWAGQAADALGEMRAVLSDLPGGSSALFDHIGSTSVPGLAAKPFVDLQIRILPLPDEAQLARRLSPLGFEPARGSRPDSPGVTHDLPRGTETVAEDVWAKHLYVDPVRSMILHVRRADSPWGRYTVWFRDWLTAHPDRARQYEQTKRALSEQNVGKADYDDYTRAKTAFFDEVQPEFERWASLR